jgi:hypothetical protein
VGFGVFAFLFFIFIVCSMFAGCLVGLQITPGLAAFLVFENRLLVTAAD